MLGWLCVVGITLVIVDMAQTLRYIPGEEWWSTEDVVAPGKFNLRSMVICPGLLGWSGAWGYFLSLVWVPYSAWRALVGVRHNVRFVAQERLLLMLVPTLILAVQLVLRTTPLRYAYPLF